MSEKEFYLVLKFDMIFSVLRGLLKFDVHCIFFPLYVDLLTWIRESKLYSIF